MLETLMENTTFKRASRCAVHIVETLVVYSIVIVDSDDPLSASHRGYIYSIGVTPLVDAGSAINDLGMSVKDGVLDDSSMDTGCTVDNLGMSVKNGVVDDYL